MAREDAENIQVASQFGPPVIKASGCIWSLRNLPEKAAFLTTTHCRCKRERMETSDALEFTAISNGL